MIDTKSLGSRFPTPWRVMREAAAYCVVDGNGLVLSRTAFDPDGEGLTALSEPEALRLAQGFAALPDLLRQLHAANFARGRPSPTEDD